MDWSYVLILCLGSLLLLVSVWIWRGRGPQARSWVRIPVVGDIASLMAFPSFGAICFGGGLDGIGAPEWLSMPIFGAGFVPVVWGFPILVIGRFYWPAQRLWGPVWYTTLSKEQGDQMELSLGDVLAVGARKPPSWARKNLNYWYCHQIDQGKPTPGHLWLNEHGIFFDPSKDLPPNTFPARTTWQNLQHFERTGRSLTVTFLKWGKPNTHTFSMSRRRAQRAEQQILQQYASQAGSE